MEDTPRNELLKLLQKYHTGVGITSILETRFLFQCVSAGLIALPDGKDS